MKTLPRAALPLALILCATTASATPSGAGPNEIVVSALTRQAALADWSKRVRSDLERNMSSASRYNQAFAEGVVTVGFHCTDSGRPDGVAVINSSGNRALDAMALRSVRKLTSLHPMVDGMRPRQKVAAQLLFMNNYGTNRNVARREQELKDSARGANRWFTREQLASGEVLFLGAAQ